MPALLRLPAAITMMLLLVAYALRHDICAAPRVVFAFLAICVR